MTRRQRADHTGPDPAFVCEHCGYTVPGRAPGTEHRNHCPSCLRSLHVDTIIGDRQSGCRGVMEAIAVAARYDGEWMLVHRCHRCGLLRANRVAGDDSEWALAALALRPIARPPFPLGRLSQSPTHAVAEESG